MTNNNHKNSGCGFAEQLVSYLYGETGAAENAAFEAHLHNCPVCADELEAFSGVQFSINDWKSKEFAGLETPVIEIPYENAGTAPNGQAVSNGTGTWLSGLRDLFSLSPAWSLATASMAVLAVCAGIALIALNSGKGNDIASGANKNSKPSAAPTVERKPEQPNTTADQNVSADKDVKPLNEPKPAKPEIAVAPETKNNRPVKAVNTSRTPQKTETSNSPKNNGTKRNNKNTEQVAPKIIEDEEEDETLRLAELFEEIGTVE